MGIAIVSGVSSAYRQRQMVAERLGMRLLEKLRKRPRPTALKVVGSIPRSGNHLVLRVISLLRGSAHQWVSANPVPSSPFRNITKSVVRETFSPLHPVDDYFHSYMHPSPALMKLYKRYNARLVFIDRDPRDLLTSYLPWVMSSPIMTMNPYLRNAYPDDNQRLLAFIKGDPQAEASPFYLKYDLYFDRGNVRVLRDSVEQWIRPYLDWPDQPLVYTVAYEDLVGPKGSGDPAVQRQEIWNIAHQLGFEISYPRLCEIVDSCYGDTATSPRGIIRRWRDESSKEHRAACKEQAGRSLIDLGYEKVLSW